MSTTPTAVPSVFPPGPLAPERPPLDLSRLQAAADGACRAIEKLIAQRAELRAALRDLLEQVEQLDGYELTRDLEPYKAEANWEDALRRAHEALRATA